MRILLLLVLSVGLIACKTEGESAAAADDSQPGFSPDGGGAVSESVSVVRKSGEHFSCFTLELTDSYQLWCENEVPVGDSVSVHFGPGVKGCSGDGVSCTGTDGYVLVAESDDEISFRVKDDTLCFSTNVQTMPFSGAQGEATYCYGVAILTGAQNTEPHIFAAPIFSAAAHGSSDLTLHATGEVFFAIDLAVDVLFDARWILTDSALVTGEETLSCDLSADESELVCPSFNVSL